MTSIAQLAAAYSIQPHVVLAALDIDGDHTDATEIDSITGWTEAEAREVLDILAAQATARD